MTNALEDTHVPNAALPASMTGGEPPPKEVASKRPLSQLPTRSNASQQRGAGRSRDHHEAAGVRDMSVRNSKT